MSQFQRLLLATAISAACLSTPAAATESSPQDQLFALMESADLSEGDVEDRYFETFSYEINRKEYVRPFRTDLEFLIYGISDIDPNSLAMFRNVLAEFSKAVGLTISFRQVHVGQLEAIAEENPRRNYLIFEPLEKFPTAKTARERVITKSPWFYLPRALDGGKLYTFPSDEITSIQEGRHEYEPTCFLVGRQQSGFIIHSAAHIDTSMPSQHQEACMWLVALTAAGFSLDPDWDLDGLAEDIASGTSVITDLDRAAMLLSISIALGAGTKPELVAERIEQIWSMRP